MGALLTEIMDGARSTFRDLRVYLFGRGVVTLAALAAGLMGSTVFGATAAATLAPVVTVALVGGVILSGVMRLREMRYNQDRMADIYRDEIADQLAIAPGQVTRQHVHLLAFGDADRGIPANPILREEIDREWNKTWLKFATSTLAAMASFGLIQFGLAHEFVSSGLKEMLGATVGNVVGATSVGIVSGLTGLFLNNGLDFGVQRITRLGELTLHDRIAKLDRDITRGKAVGKEQVFALFVAADHALDRTIMQRYGKHYDLLPQAKKSEIVEALGAATPMQGIADDLNSKRISAGAVAFIITGQLSVKATPATHATPLKPVILTPTHETPSAQQQPRFVERVGNPRGDEGLSHTEREALRRAATELETAR